MKRRLGFALCSAVAATLLAGCAASVPATPAAGAAPASPAHIKAPCVYLLGKVEASNLSRMRITAPNCYIYINDTANMSYSTIKAAEILYAGSAPNEARARFPEATPAPGSVVTNPCRTIRSCAYLTKHPPETSGCSPGSFNGYATIGAPGQVTCFSNLKISGPSNTTCGVITITGSQLQLDGANISSCSSGVTFAMSSATSDINFSGANLTLAPPATGRYKDMLFYRVAAQSNSVNFSGCACNFTGILYFPTAQVSYTSTGGNYQLLIFGQVNFSTSNLRLGNPP